MDRLRNGSFEDNLAGQRLPATDELLAGRDLDFAVTILALLACRIGVHASFVVGWHAM